MVFRPHKWSMILRHGPHTRVPTPSNKFGTKWLQLKLAYKHTKSIPNSKKDIFAVFLLDCIYILLHYLRVSHNPCVGYAWHYLIASMSLWTVRLGSGHNGRNILRAVRTLESLLSALHFKSISEDVLRWLSNNLVFFLSFCVSVLLSPFCNSPTLHLPSVYGRSRMGKRTVASERIFWITALSSVDTRIRQTRTLKLLN